MSRAYDISTLVLSVLACGGIVANILLTPACVSAQFVVHIVLFAHSVYTYRVPIVTFSSAQVNHNHDYRQTCEVSINDYPRRYHSFKNLLAHEFALGCVLVLCWTMPSAPITAFEGALLSLLICVVCRTRILLILLVGNFLILLRFMQYPSLGSVLRFAAFLFGALFTRLLPHRGVLHIICAMFCLLHARTPLVSVFSAVPSLVVFSVLRDYSRASDCVLLTSVSIWVSIFLIR